MLGNPAVPLLGEAKGIRESRYILKTIGTALGQAGASVANAVWLNQQKLSLAR